MNSKKKMAHGQKHIFFEQFRYKMNEKNVFLVRCMLLWEENVMVVLLQRNRGWLDGFRAYPRALFVNMESGAFSIP